MRSEKKGMKIARQLKLNRKTTTATTTTKTTLVFISVKKNRKETKRNLPAQHLYFAHFCMFPAYTLCLFGEHLIIYVLHFTFALTSFVNLFECTYTLHSHTHVHIHTEWTELWKGYLKKIRRRREQQSLLPYSQHKRQPKQATFRVLHHYGLPGRTKNNQREFKRKIKCV